MESFVNYDEIGKSIDEMENKIKEEVGDEIGDKALNELYWKFISAFSSEYIDKKMVDFIAYFMVPWLKFLEKEYKNILKEKNK